MVDILPFKGLRYNIKKINSYSKVLAPPYDIIDENQKTFLKDLSLYNIVRLTLPDDTSGKSRYENAGDILSDWIDKRILEFDRDESFYIFRGNFNEDGNQKSFYGFTSLLKIEQYGKGKVLRHEKTLPKPKEDRLSLLTACRTNFEFIYTIYNDDDKKVTDILNSVMQKAPDMSANALYDNMLSFDVWKLSSGPEIKNITALMKNKTVLIADGHHRYETSRLYKESIQEKQNINNINDRDHKSNLHTGQAEDYILCLFVSGNQKEISIHPTHRLVKFSGEITAAEMIKKLSICFNIEKIRNAEDVIIKKMKECRQAGKKCLCVCFKDSSCYFAELKSDLEPIYSKLDAPATPFDEEFEYLDVNILHKLIFQELLKENKVAEIKFLHTIKEVNKHLLAKDTAITFDAGFILNAPQIKTVESLSDKGLIMPQKSTYFYPKPCSGIVLYKFEER